MSESLGWCGAGCSLRGVTLGDTRNPTVGTELRSQTPQITLCSVARAGVRVWVHDGCTEHRPHHLFPAGPMTALGSGGAPPAQDLRLLKRRPAPGELSASPIPVTHG